MGPSLIWELTAGKDNGKLSAVDQKRLTAVMRGLGTGELKHPRFTKEEAAASGEVVHERLWNYILSLESPEVYFGGSESIHGVSREHDPQGSGWLGCLRRMATRYGRDPRGLKQDRLRPVHAPLAFAAGRFGVLEVGGKLQQRLPNSKSPYLQVAKAKNGEREVIGKKMTYPKR